MGVEARKILLRRRVEMLSILRRERILRQLSLYDIRDRTGISVSKLSLIERGIDQPNAEDKIRLAKALGISEQDLFPSPAVKKGEEVTR